MPVPTSVYLSNMDCIYQIEPIFRYTNWEQIDGKRPLLFDYDNNPKLSYYSVVEALQSTEG